MGKNPLLPHNNRAHTSSTLRTNSMWSCVIGYDPYAGDGEVKKVEDDGAADVNF